MKINKQTNVDTNGYNSDEISFNATKVNTLNGDYIRYEVDLRGSINNYFELEIESLGLGQSRIVFPINFEHPVLNMSNLSTVLLNSNHLVDHFTLENNLNVSKLSKTKCYWFIYDKNSQIPCQKRLQLNANLSQSQIHIDDFKLAELIIYSKSIPEFFQFSRVLFVNDSRPNKCKHNGLLNQNEGCECRPGFGGSLCEIACEEGHFGFKCDLNCPKNDCTGFLICTQDPIGCQCGSGFYSDLYCTRACLEKYWGPSCALKCDHCKTEKCNRFTGECVQECSNDGSCLNENKKTNECILVSNLVECLGDSYLVETYNIVGSFNNFTCVKRIDHDGKFRLDNFLITLDSLLF